MSTPKRLTRSRDQRIISGVCGGIAEYFDADPALVRLGFVAVSVLSAAFPGVLIYILAIVIVPEAPEK